MHGEPPALRMRWLAARAALAQLLTGTHRYLGTGCLHGDHDYCQSMVGQAGRKRPGECKGQPCRAQCICPCHRR